MEDYFILEGNISVKASILANRREIVKVIVDKQKKDKDTSYILHRAKERNITIEYVEREAIDILAEGKTHGGMLAYAKQRTFAKLDEVVGKDNLFLAIVEGVEDPFNFGYILRTLYAAGCDAVIIPQRNWTSAAGVVTKSSAGASEYIDLIVADDMSAILNELKNNHVAIVCGQRSDAISLYDYTFPQRVCVAIGGEMRGLSKQILTMSDQNIYIPYNEEFRNALNGASATAVIAFEYVRQTLKK